MTFVTKISSTLFPAGQSTMPNSKADPFSQTGSRYSHRAFIQQKSKNGQRNIEFFNDVPSIGYNKPVCMMVRGEHLFGKNFDFGGKFDRISVIEVLEGAVLWGQLSPVPQLVSQAITIPTCTVTMGGCLLVTKQASGVEIRCAHSERGGLCTAESLFKWPLYGADGMRWNVLFVINLLFRRPRSVT